MEKFNPHSNEWLLNKFEIYRELRSMETAYWSEKYQMHVITRYTDVFNALKDHATFSSAKGNLVVEDPERFNRTLGASDGDRHALLKDVVKNAYAKDNIERINTVFRQKAEELLNGSSIVNISEITNQLSAWSVVETINPPCNKEYLKDLIVHMQRHSSMCVSTNVDDTSSIEFKKLFNDLTNVNSQVEPNGPGIYYQYVKNNPNHYHMPSLFNGPAVSGASSLTGAMQFLILDLHRHGKLKEIIADRSLVQNAVHESLRYHATTGRFTRTATKDVTMHGTIIKNGDRVVLCLDSANRDPYKFVNPDIFDLYRDTQGHLAFGYGMHACIALAISKTLLVSFLETVLNAIGEYKILVNDKDLIYVMTASGNNDMLTNLVIEKV